MTNSPEPSQSDAASAIQRSNSIDGNVKGAPAVKPGPGEAFTIDYNPDHDYAKDPLDAGSTSQPAVFPSLEDDLPNTRVVQVPLLKVASAPALLVAIASTVVVVIGLSLNSFWLILAGSLIALTISLRLALPTLREVLRDLTADQQALLISLPGIILGIYGIMQVSGINRQILIWGRNIRWDVVGALGDFLGALGQIFIAMLALYVAWRQFTISRDLTTQQNVITQQQTIDAYFQGISELVLDDEGLLEDWPQERIIAEARTAAILSSVDAAGKSKVLRFLSGSRLLTPLARDRRLGRPILDGTGGYAEDRMEGIRVIDLGVMLAAGDLAENDLRWVDLSGANLIRANLSGVNLVRANLSRTILCDATLTEADMMGARLFYGEVETASPRTRTDTPNYETGEFTGAVVEGADFTNVRRLSETQRCYCCAWGGHQTRTTIPGGCSDVPNLLGR
ncbi:MAG: pentapeptide repeat-containing protein [Cyanobacteria bacterium P01_G01_bin.38]